MCAFSDIDSYFVREGITVGTKQTLENGDKI